MTLRLFLFLLVIATLSAPVHAAIVGKPRIIDGDTIEIAGTPIRLYGIDAPETGQTCVADGKTWHCGTNAAFALAELIGGNWVACRIRDVDSAPHVEGVCHLAGFEGPEINRRIVAAGWALADPRTGSSYSVTESAARRAGLGIWRGRFVAPWDWRRGKRLGREPRR